MVLLTSEPRLSLVFLRTPTSGESISDLRVVHAGKRDTYKLGAHGS
jgi:hypothetical protein